MDNKIIWTPYQENYLINNINKITLKDIGKNINKTSHNIYKKIQQLNLIVDKEVIKKRKQQMLVERNKTMGRDLNFEIIKNIASQFNSKIEFQHKDSSAYNTARNNGYLNIVCSHMQKLSFSIPQLHLKYITEILFNQKCQYNTRKIIKPYEIDVYFPNLKIGFEYNGKGWHEKDKIDKVKICKEKGILLIILKENNRKYSEDIKLQLINNLDIINQHTGYCISSNEIQFLKYDIQYPNLFSQEEKEFIKGKYKYEIYKLNLPLYIKLKKYNFWEGVIDPLSEKFFWTEDLIKEKISKLTSKKLLYKTNHSLYLIIHRKKLQYLLKDVPSI